MNSVAVANHKLSAIARFVRNSDRAQVSLPNHLLNDLDYVEDAQHARAFRVENLLQLKMVTEAKAILERSLPGASDRRRYELKLADMIQHKVLPLYGDIDPNLKELPAKLRACRDSGLVGVTAQGHVKHRWPEKCNQSKLCAHEAREEGQRLAERYLKPVSNFLRDHRSAKLQYWVISPKNCEAGNLHQTKRDIMRIFSKLNRRKVARSVAGSIAVQEDPLGRNSDEWNVHLNVLAIIDGPFHWKAYRREFMNELGHDRIQIEFITEHRMRQKSAAKSARRAKIAGVPSLPMTRYQVITDAFVELVKYVTKITGYDHAKKALTDAVPVPGKATESLEPGVNDRAVALPEKQGQGRSDAGRSEAAPMYAWSGERWFEWYKANRGFRRTRSYGVLYRVCDRCGSYDHSERHCGATAEPEPEIEWIGSIEWRDFESGYSHSIDLIPAHKSASEYHYQPSFDRQNRGPP